MDINYLLILQDFRNSINDAWTPFMLWISHFAVAYLLIVPAFIYWCIDKKKGLYILASAVVSICINSVIKLTACIYRPWIRDSRIIPSEEAIKESTGYSFPSGHTTTSTPIYAGIIVTYGKRKIVACISVLMLALTLFSRNYLGVHTPQDVIAGFLIGILSLFIIHKLFLYLDKHPEKENKVLLTGILLAAAAIVYITVKPYPLDYVDGELLADPTKMTVDGYKDIGLLGAFCAGRFLEKKFIRFEAAGINLKGVILSVIGVIPLFIITKVLPKHLDVLFGEHFGGLISRSLLMLFIITIWPAVIKAFHSAASPGRPGAMDME